MVQIASIIVLGIFAQWLAWRFKVPAILPLIITGLLVGPLSTLWSDDGLKLIQPIWENGSGLFPGQNLFYFVELAIGIILFEGGLTLKRDEIREVGPDILKLITLGSIVTFFGAGVVAHFLIGLSWTMSFLFSALIIVTGPTVIAPILRNIPLKTNVAAVLKWEGILIDPIGALAAVLVFEFINTIEGGASGGQFTQHALLQFIQILLIGASLGFFAAFTMRELLRRNWIPHYLLNVFTLAFVMMVFVASGLIVHDSGLLTVVVMGLVMGNMEIPHLKEILYFKESISVLLISVLFILLSANINIVDLELLLNWKCIGLFLFVILILRPLGVFMSTRNSTLSVKEKLFVSWVGPRGIVAAGIASLFGTKLMNKEKILESGETILGIPGAEYITPLVFMIVLGTVLLNATTARLIAKMLGVVLDKSNGILIVGANSLAQAIGKYLIDNGRSVTLVDSNASNIKKSIAKGVPAIEANIYNDDLSDNLELNETGFLFAITGSSQVNQYALNNLSEQFGENGAYRLITEDEMTNKDVKIKDKILGHDDYVNMSEALRTFPDLKEMPISTLEEFDECLNKFKSEHLAIPLFVKDLNGEIHLISQFEGHSKITEGFKIVYIGADEISKN